MQVVNKVTLKMSLFATEIKTETGTPPFQPVKDELNVVGVIAVIETGELGA